MISGIQQMGIGVSDVRAAFKWYREAFGMDVPIFEEAATAALMLPYTAANPAIDTPFWRSICSAAAAWKFGNTPRARPLALIFGQNWAI